MWHSGFLTKNKILGMQTSMLCSSKNLNLQNENSLSKTFLKGLNNALKLATEKYIFIKVDCLFPWGNKHTSLMGE
jgi:hypothetical protein